nr:MAG TPA: Portal protein [Caudoviricetes sp.]
MLYNVGNGDVFGFKLTEQKKKQFGEKDTKLTKWLGKFERSWNYAKQNYHQKWENNWKLYRNIRIKRSHDGVVQTFVPMVNSAVNTIVAELFNSNPLVNYVPNHPDQESDTKVLNEIYADFALRDNWVQKNKVNGRQGLITGNFCAFYEWIEDRDGGYVHKINIPIRDMIIDPSSSSYEDWKYVGRRFFADKKSLEEETIYDFKTDSYKKRYKNLDEVISGGKDEDDDKSKKDQMIGSIDDNKDRVELIEIWTKTQVVVIANRSTIIEERENPHYALAKSQQAQRKAEAQLKGEEIAEDDKVEGLLPFAHGRIYADISLPYGDSDVDIIADQQELLNELTELNIEALLYTLYPEKTLDPKFSEWIDDMEPAPGKIYPLPQGAMSWNNPPSIPTGIAQERLNIKDEIRESSAISRISKGASATGSTTATEIKNMLGQMDSRIQEKAQTLANEFFFQEAKIVLKLIQLYAPEQMWVRTLGDAKVSFDEINPRQFLGEYTPMITLDIQRKLQRSEEQEAYTQAYQILIQDPTNNLSALKKIMFRKMFPDLTQEEIEQIITPPEQSEQGQQGQLPQGEATIPQEAMAGDQMEGDEYGY